MLDKIKMYVKEHTTSCFWQVGDIMNTMRNIALMAMGSALTLAYQKYNKPMMKAVKNTFNKAANGAKDLTNQLDNMM